MAIARRKPDPDGITRARTRRHGGPLREPGTARRRRRGGRAAGDRGRPRRPARRTGRGDHSASTPARNRDEWPRKALEAALCIAAGADLTRLTEWIAVGQERAREDPLDEGHIERPPRALPSSPRLAGISVVRVRIGSELPSSLRIDARNVPDASDGLRNASPSPRGASERGVATREVSKSHAMTLATIYSPSSSCLSRSAISSVSYIPGAGLMVRRTFLSAPSEILNGPQPYDDDTPTAAGQVLLAPEPRAGSRRPTAWRPRSTPLWHDRAPARRFRGRLLT